MNRNKAILMVGNGVLLAVLALGCDGVDEYGGADEPGEVEFRPGSGAGGVWLNTNAIGTHQFSEIDLLEGSHDGVRLVRVRVKGPNDTWPELEKVEFNNGQLRGKLGSTYYTGEGLVESKWDVKLVVGGVENPAEMWISEFEEAEPGELRYTFHYNDVNGDPVPLCDPDPEGDIAAVPIQDITVNDTTGAIGTRANTLYLGCTSGAVGKAVVWGYKPWTRTLKDFEAAVRMVRADYCYDGHSWTVPGTPIEVRDLWDINDFINESHPTEAIWGPNGLQCLGTPRNTGYGYPQVTCGGQTLPACSPTADLVDYPGAVYWTKNDPQ